MGVDCYLILDVGAEKRVKIPLDRYFVFQAEFENGKRFALETVLSKLELLRGEHADSSYAKGWIDNASIEINRFNHVKTVEIADEHFDDGEVFCSESEARQKII